MSHPFPRERPQRARTALALVVCALAAVASLAVRPVGAATPAPTPEAASALDWLAGELNEHGGSLPGFLPGSSDWGLTADALLAFVAAGRADDPAAVAATDLLAENAGAYTTWAPDMPEVRDAGATAKVLLAMLSTGRGPVVSGVDLESELRALMVRDGGASGRFADRVPDPAWDASNGFGQALSVLALALTPGGAPDEAVAYLRAQQCPSGGFRLNYLDGATCSTDTEADTDATAIALQALLVVPRSEDVSVALERGVRWLLSQQHADGSFGGTGPTEAPNSNSTGLISQTLRAAGLTEAADRGARWITEGCQLDATSAEGTPAEPDAGAIGYNPASKAAALAEGITDQSADQWRRSTTQAVLALGLAPFGPHDIEPLPPITTTSSTTTSTTTSTSPPSSTTTIPSTTTIAAPGTGAAPAPQPQWGGAAPPPVAHADPPGGDLHVLDTYSSSPAGGASGRAPAARLAQTGSDDTAPRVAVALGLIIAGVLIWTTRDRRRV